MLSNDLEKFYNWIRDLDFESFYSYDHKIEIESLIPKDFNDELKELALKYAKYLKYTLHSAYHTGFYECKDKVINKLEQRENRNSFWNIFNIF